MSTNEAATDSMKLRALAAWFDKWDGLSYPDRDRELDIFREGSDEVQQDLRRIAAVLAIAGERSAGAAPLESECDCDCHLCDCYLRHSKGTDR